MALDGVSADARNRDRGAGVALEALREMVTATDAEPTLSLSLFSEPAGDPVAELLDSYDEAVEEYGEPAAHGAVELLARIAAAAVKELAARRDKDPEKVLIKLAKQFGQVDGE
jgi:hypothetical protein